MCSAETIGLRLFSSAAAYRFSKALAAAAPRLSYSAAAMSLSEGHRHFQPRQPTSAANPEAPHCYPVPLSPPLPAISKPMELERAMSASSRSSLFVLESERIVYEDEWLIAVNKPPGVYCERVLESASRVLGDSDTSADSDELTGGTPASNSWIFLSLALNVIDPN